MTTRRLLAAAWLLAGLLAACGHDAGEPAAERLFPPPSAERVAALLKEIEAPGNPHGIRSLPAAGGKEQIELMVGTAMWGQGGAAVEELVGTEMAIDGDLLRMARTSERFEVRLRAVEALLLRQHPEASPILTALTRSNVPAERYVAWRLASDAVRRSSVGPVSAEAAVERLTSEPVSRVRERVIRYVGEIGAREAIPLLLDWLRAGTYADETSWALLSMRVPEAIQVALARNPGDFQALALAGPHAAEDYALTHLDDWFALDVLVASRDPRAPAVVEAELVRMRALPEEERIPDKERELQIALIRLRSVDPAPELLALVEDPAVDRRLRLTALGHVSTASNEARLARAYARETDPELLDAFESALGESRASGVTDAMLHHAQVWEAHGKITDPTYFVWAINRRLGTAYASLDEVRALAKSRGIR